MLSIVIPSLRLPEVPSRLDDGQVVKVFDTLLGHVEVRDNNKVFKYSRVSPTTLEDPKQEAEIAQRFKEHPNIVKTLGLFQQGPDYVLVTENAGTDLFYIISSLKAQELRATSPRIFRKLAFETLLSISSALCVIHAAECAHLDVSIENILLRNRTLTLIDFGQAVQKDAKGGWSNAGFHGKATIIAPELCATTFNKDPRPADMWSLGIVFVTLLTGDCFQIDASSAMCIDRVGIKAIIEAKKLQRFFDAPALRVAEKLICSASTRWTAQELQDYLALPSSM